MSNPPFLPPKIRLPFYTFSREIWMATADWYVENEMNKMGERAKKVVECFDGFEEFVAVISANKFIWHSPYFTFCARRIDYDLFHLLFSLSPYCFRDEQKLLIMDFRLSEEERIRETRRHQSGLWRGFQRYVFSYHRLYLNNQTQPSTGLPPPR